MHPKNYILKEKQILASFISKLPEAIIICDAEGSILLHDYQSETYLLSGKTKQAGLVTGKPITSIIDKNLIEHALDEINEQLKHHVTNTVSTFILQKNNRVLKTQIVPVLNLAGLFSGFVLILEDITLQSQAEKRVESLLKTLSKNARSPMASIRAAIEAMKEFPGMDENRQHQFVDIIHEEAIVLSDILNRVSNEYTNLINVNRSLKPLFIKDLIQTISRRSLDKLGIICHIKRHSHAEQISIKADPYSFVSAVLFVLDRLKFVTGVTKFYFSFHIKNKIVFLDIIWKGDSVSPELIKQWESRDIAIPNQISNICLKDVLDQHQSVLWTYSEHDDFDNMPYLRFFIPADHDLSSASFEPVSTIPESRIEIRDIELFNHSDQTVELDNRLLTELSYTSLIREINRASRVEDIIGKHSQLPRLIHSMLTSGTKIRTITWLITAFSDAILSKILKFATAELGPPPVPFAFVIMGSEGRKEQTLKTDQDNAIIFKDPGAGETIENLQAYFLKLGEKVCTWLDQSGFDFCQGGIMAKNPKWCQPLSIWKNYFSSWIHSAGPEDLLHTSIFFDFQFAYGDRQITDDLTAHLFDSLSNWAGFFRNMAENAVYFKPPIGLFGNFLVRSKDPHKHCIDIKMVNIPIVDFARIYSLKHHIKATSTQDRLYQLYVKKVLSRHEYNELEQAYSFIMQIRFMGQIQAILGQNIKAHNFINPKQLSSIEKKMLKEVLKKIRSFQAQLTFDFIGATDQQIS
jgi:CBS domain-containing protein